jgi:hypothetical protein
MASKDSRNTLLVQHMIPPPITSGSDLLFHRDYLSGTLSVLYQAINDWATYGINTAYRDDKGGHYTPKFQMGIVATPPTDAGQVQSRLSYWVASKQSVVLLFDVRGG